MKHTLTLSNQQPEQRISASTGFTGLELYSACLKAGMAIAQEPISIRFQLQNKDHSFECRSWLIPGTAEFGPIDLLQATGQIPSLAGLAFTSLIIKPVPLPLLVGWEIEVEMNYATSESVL